MNYLFLLLLLLPSLAGGQKPVEPIRVTIRAARHDANIKMAAAVRDGLRARRDIEIANVGAQYEIRLNTTALVPESCAGYAVAVEVEDLKSGRATLDVYAGPTPEEIARRVLETVNQEFFAKRRLAPKGN